MAGVVEPRPPPSARPAIELVDEWQREVQSSYRNWSSQLGMIRSMLVAPEGPAQLPGLEREILLRRVQQANDQLTQLQQAMSPVVQQELTVQEILKMKEALARFQTIVVGAYPPDRVSDLLGTIAAALVGGGGVAYALSAGLTTAIVFWILGAITLALTVFFRVRHQVKLDRFFHDRLEVL